MKINPYLIRSAVLLIHAFLLNSHTMQAQTTTASCKCPIECKCRINGECKCGTNGRCEQAQTACQCSTNKQLCKCGTACKCKQSGDKPTCKCHQEHSTTSRMMSHNHPTSLNPFLQMMDTMMIVMDAVPLTNSVERDFLAQMIPHHQAAIQMAQYQIAHGKNFEMIQLAKSILAEQQGEIMDMNAMLTAYPTTGGNVNPAYKKAMDKTMEVMMANTPTDAQLPDNVDCCFAAVMLPHHQAAVDMAVAVLRFNPRNQIEIYAHRIIGDQMVEIEQMSEYINKNCKK